MEKYDGTDDKPNNKRRYHGVEIWIRNAPVLLSSPPNPVCRLLHFQYPYVVGVEPLSEISLKVDIPIRPKY